jgi:hypothetical protein
MADFRLKIAHKDDCPAVEYVKDGTWGSAWWLPGSSSYRATDGTRKGTTVHWLDLACNIIDCPATAMVSGVAIDRFIGTLDAGSQ